MGERRLAAMRRVAAVRAAQQMVAEARLHADRRAAARAGDALTAAGSAAEAAFAGWQAAAEGACFRPELLRHHAAEVIGRSADADAAQERSAQAKGALDAARRGLCHAEAAVERSGRIVADLQRAERSRLEDRRMAEHADTVTRKWWRP